MKPYSEAEAPVDQMIDYKLKKGGTPFHAYLVKWSQTIIHSPACANGQFLNYEAKLGS